MTILASIKYTSRAFIKYTISAAYYFFDFFDIILILSLKLKNNYIFFHPLLIKFYYNCIKYENLYFNRIFFIFKSKDNTY